LKIKQCASMIIENLFRIIKDSLFLQPKWLSCPEKDKTADSRNRMYRLFL
jgi:hypothetical protein